MAQLVPASYPSYVSSYFGVQHNYVFSSDSKKVNGSLLALSVLAAGRQWAARACWMFCSVVYQLECYWIELLTGTVEKAFSSKNIATVARLQRSREYKLCLQKLVEGWLLGMRQDKDGCTHILAVLIWKTYPLIHMMWKQRKCLFPRSHRPCKICMARTISLAMSYRASMTSKHEWQSSFTL